MWSPFCYFPPRLLRDVIPTRWTTRDRHKQQNSVTWYSRGGRLHECREAQFRSQLTQQTFINKIQLFFAWSNASVTVELNSSVFWVIMQHNWFQNRGFGTTYLSHLQESSLLPTFWDNVLVPSRVKQPKKNPRHNFVGNGVRRWFPEDQLFLECFFNYLDSSRCDL